MRNHLKGSVAVLALLGGPAIAQQAEGVVVETCAPVVTVTQTPPEIRITIPDDSAADPQVVVLQAPPVVEVVQCPPVVTGAEAQVTEAEAEIVVNAAESAELVVTRMEAAGQTGDQEPGQAAMTEGQAADEAATGLVTNEAADPDAATDATGDQAAQAPAGLVGEGEVATGGMTDVDANQPTETATLAAPEPTEPQATETQATGAAETEPAGTDAGAQLDPQSADQTEAQTGATGGSPAGPTGAVQPSVETGVTPPATTLNTQAEATDGPVTEGMEVEQDRQSDGIIAPAPGATMPAETQAAPEPAPAADPVSDMPDTPQGQPLLREGNAALTPDEASVEGLEGADVVASDDEVVGQIGSVDPASGTILVGVGGFLGLGERDLMLPMDEVSFQRDADGVLRAYLAVPSDAVEAMADQQAGQPAQ